MTDKTFAFYLGCIMPNRYPQIEKATRYVMDRLGYTLLEMERAACCPAPGVLRSFNKADWMVAAARNLCIAEKLGVDLLTVCNGCFGTLQEVNRHLKEDATLRTEVNGRLRNLGDYEFKGTIAVRHIAEVLAVEIGPTAIQPFLTRKIHATAVVHYGCHFLKPVRVRELDSPEQPRILDEFVEALGVHSHDFPQKLTCCGAGGGVKSAFGTTSMTILQEKLHHMASVTPDFIVDICPFCHLQFETGQDWLNKNRNTTYDIPVIHLSQLTAYAMGMEESFIGLQYQLMGKAFHFTSEVIASHD